MHFYSRKLKKLIVLLLMSSMFLTNVNLVHADEFGDELILDERIEDDNYDVSENEMDDDNIVGTGLTDELDVEEIVIDEAENSEVISEKVVIEDVSKSEDEYITEYLDEDIVVSGCEEVAEYLTEEVTELDDAENLECFDENDIESEDEEDIPEYYDENEGCIVEDDSIANEDGKITVPIAGEGFSGKAYYEWAQKMSKNSYMRSSGCRICSFSKMLYEAGFKDDMDPDKYFAWGKNNDYFEPTCSEKTTFGQSAVGYVKQKGASASIVKKIDISGYSSDNANTVMNLMKSGYYVVLWSGKHAVYVSRTASLDAGYPIIYDSSFGSSAKWMGKYGTIIKWKDYTAYNFTHITAFNINNPAKKKIYTIDYVLNGGVNSSNNYSTYVEGSPLSFSVPSRNGYKFDGWYKESTFSNKITQTPNSGNVTVYAKWIADNPYVSINYVLNGGTNSSSNPTKVYENVGHIFLEKATRSGYAFAGWYFDSSFTKPVGTYDVRYYNFNDRGYSRTLYARWISDKTYEYNGSIYKLSQAERVNSSADGKVMLFYYDMDWYSTEDAKGNIDSYLSENSLCIVQGTYTSERITAANIIYDCKVVNSTKTSEQIWLGNDQVIALQGGPSGVHSSCTPRCTDIVFGDKFSTAEVTDFYSFLGGVDDTEYIDFNKIDTSSAISMRGMFARYDVGGSGPNKMKVFDLSNFDTSHVKDMSDMFYKQVVEEVNLSSFDTSHVTNMSNMFWKCKNIKELDLSSFDMSNVTNVDKMLAELDGLETLYTPKKTRGVVPELPFVMYDSKGNEYYGLPAYSDKSIKLTREKPSFKVTFNTNGGSAIDPYEKVIISSKISKPVNPSKNGYKFAGWYKDSACTKAWNFSTDTVTKNVTLYAKWNKVDNWNEWVQYGTKWKYRGSDGTFVKDCWMKINSKWYHFGKDEYMQTGWQKIVDKWYYMNDNGVMQTGWQKVGGTWYYLNTSGVMQTGWFKDGTNWYYLNTSGAMQTGWQKIDGKWYYLNTSGVMATGWIKVGTKEYYLYSDGHMAANEWIGKYHVNANGVWDKTR